MKRTMLAAVFCAVAALAAGAQAQGYLGLAVGTSRADVDCAGTISCDRTDTAYKLIGGYMVNSNFGVEAAYYNQGKVTLTGNDPQVGLVRGEFKGDGLGLYALGVMPVDRFSLFAKAGLVSSKIKLTATSSLFGSAGISERSTNFAWGLGAGYEFTRNVGARMEFERVRVKFDGEKVDADLWTVGVLYRF